MHVLFTVGSTRFDALVSAVFSPPVLQALQKKGYTQLFLQHGNSTFEFYDAVDAAEAVGISWEAVAFKPSLKEDIEKADLVISHAGSGTILDVLRTHKPLIVVPNPTLLDNHQQELANELAKGKYLVASTIDHLANSIASLDTSQLARFPPQDTGRFRALVDGEMGF